MGIRIERRLREVPCRVHRPDGLLQVGQVFTPSKSSVATTGVKFQCRAAASNTLCSRNVSRVRLLSVKTRRGQPSSEAPGDRLASTGQPIRSRGTCKEDGSRRGIVKVHRRSVRRVLKRQPAACSRPVYRVLQSLQDSRLGCLALCLGQGRLCRASLLSPLVPLAQAGR